MRPLKPINRVGWRLDELMSKQKPKVKIAPAPPAQSERRENSKARISEAVRACKLRGHSVRDILAAAEIERPSITKWTKTGLVQKREDTLDRFALALGVEVESIFTDKLRYVAGREPGTIEHWEAAMKQASRPEDLVPSSHAAGENINPSRWQIHADLDVLLDSPAHASAIAQVIRSMRMAMQQAG